MADFTIWFESFTRRRACRSYSTRRSIAWASRSSKRPPTRSRVYSTRALIVVFSKIELFSKSEIEMSHPAPAAHFNLFLLRNVLDAETCAQLRTELTEAPTTQAPVYIQGSDGVVHEDVRKTTSVHPASETFSEIHARLLQQQSALEQHFGETL